MFGNKAEVLQTILRPETVIALENVSFSLRANALPGVLEASESIDEVLLTGDNPDEEMIDVVREMHISPDTEERMVVLGSHVIAAGLVYDQDSSHLDPCEPGSANGSIFHASTRRGDGEQQRYYYEALGLDGDGNKDFDCQVVLDRLLKRVMKGIGNDLSTFTRLLHRLRATQRPVSKASLEDVIRFSLEQQGFSYALDYLADSLWGVAYWNRMDDNLRDVLQPLADLFSESEAEICWDEALAAGEIGNPLAVPLDIFEHGGILYSLTGTGTQCRWDTSRAAAVWVPDDDAVDNIRSSALSELGLGKVAWFGACGSETDPLHARYSLDGETWVGEGMGWKWREAQSQLIGASPKAFDPKELDSVMQAKAVEYCKGLLSEYNDWINGNVYGVVCYVIDRSTGQVLDGEADECWGYIGQESAEAELDALVLSKVLEYGKTVH